MRRATSCSSGSAIATSARVAGTRGWLGGSAPARGWNRVQRAGSDARGWLGSSALAREGRGGGAGPQGAWPPPPAGGTVIHRVLSTVGFKTLACFLCPEHRRPRLKDVRAGPRRESGLMEYTVYAGPTRVSGKSLPGFGRAESARRSSAQLWPHRPALPTLLSSQRVSAELRQHHTRGSSPPPPPVPEDRSKKGFGAGPEGEQFRRLRADGGASQRWKSRHLAHSSLDLGTQGATFPK